jgi:uncharacterized protein
MLVDANLLVYAYVADFPEHDAGRQWLDSRLAGPIRVGLPWESLVAFMRLVTNPREFPRPARAPEAMAQVTAWLSHPVVWYPTVTENHAELLIGLLRSPGMRADLVPDAHLAAIAIGHGLVLMSNDGDFARFPGLRWENPLAA